MDERGDEGKRVWMVHMSSLNFVRAISLILPTVQKNKTFAFFATARGFPSVMSSVTSPFDVWGLWSVLHFQDKHKKLPQQRHTQAHSQTKTHIHRLTTVRVPDDDAAATLAFRPASMTPSFVMYM
jgi:hypothetical protein